MTRLQTSAAADDAPDSGAVTFRCSHPGSRVFWSHKPGFGTFVPGGAPNVSVVSLQVVYSFGDIVTADPDEIADLRQRIAAGGSPIYEVASPAAA